MAVNHFVVGSIPTYGAKFCSVSLDPAGQEILINVGLIPATAAKYMARQFYGRMPALGSIPFPRHQNRREKMLYYQAHLKSIEGHNTIGYIEEKAAKVGVKVTLPEQDNEESLWEVVSVSSKGVSKEYLNTARRNLNNHRKATDI